MQQIDNWRVEHELDVFVWDSLQGPCLLPSAAGAPSFLPSAVSVPRYLSYIVCTTYLGITMKIPSLQYMPNPVRPAPPFIISSGWVGKYVVMGRCRPKRDALGKPEALYSTLMQPPTCTCPSTTERTCRAMPETRRISLGQVQLLPVLHSITVTAQFTAQHSTQWHARSHSSVTPNLALGGLPRRRLNQSISLATICSSAFSHYFPGPDFPPPPPTASPANI